VATEYHADKISIPFILHGFAGPPTPDLFELVVSLMKIYNQNIANLTNERNMDNSIYK